MLGIFYTKTINLSPEEFLKHLNKWKDFPCLEIGFNTAKMALLA